MPQWEAEGKTPATYGVTPGSPTYAQGLCDAILMDNSTPTTVDDRIGGDVDRQKRHLVRKNNQLTLRGKLQNEDETLLEWFFKKPDGTDGSPDESRSWVQAYEAVSGNTNYQHWKGCKPMSSTLSLGPDFTTFEGVMSFLSKTENTTAITTLDNALTNLPLTQKDLPTNPFQWDGDNYDLRSASISVAFEEAQQDALSTEDILYRKPTHRNISGSFEFFKKNGDMQSDAEDQEERAMVIKVSSSITLTFAGAVVDPSGEDIRGDTSDATIESHNFTAKSVTVS